MTSGKRKKFNIKIIASLMVLTLFCPVFAEDITLPNPAKFEPLQIKTTAEINTETSRMSESRNIPASDIPIPEVINSFFAPIEDSPQLRSKSNAVITQSVAEIPTLRIPEPASEISFQSLSEQIEENPFTALNTITLPSEYKPKQQSSRFTIREDSNLIPSMPPDENASYTSTVVEEEEYEDYDCDGKTIAGVRFKGLNRISENVLLDIIKTQKGSKFNYQRLRDDLQNIYAIGYFKDNMYIEPEMQENGEIEITFVLEENIIVDKAVIEGNSVLAQSELEPFVKKLEGLPQNLNLINESIEDINSYYASKGYILAKVTNVEDNADGKLIFVISEGIVEEINIEGNKKTKDYIIKRNMLTKPGTVYNEEIIKKDLSKVYSTQIFEEIDRIIEPSKTKEGEYKITIKVKEASSNSVSLGVGLDNALGAFGSVAYNEKNLFGRNQKLSLSGMLGSGLLLSDSSIKNRMNWNIELNFFEPRFLSEDNTLSSKIYYRDLGSYQIPLAIEQRWGWNNIIEHKIMSYDNLTTSLALGYECINLKEGDFNKISALYRQNNIDISKRRDQLKGGSYFNIAPGIKYSTLDSETNPRDGWIAKGNFIESLGLTSTKRTNGRVMGSITKYIPIAQKSTLLVGVKGGTKVHGEDMPEVMAFRLGGPYTIRGFHMNGVGSGESFIMGSAEIQTPIPLMDKLKYDFFKNLRFAFFVDAGKIYEPTISSKLYDRPLSAITMGVGLRVNIPGMSTITIDYGLPLTHTGKYSSQHGYFTFGTGGLYDSY